VRVWRNTGPAGNWLAVEALQGPPNRDAVGGWIEVRLGSHVSRSEITVGGGHAGGEWLPHHFGLGEADSAEVRVIWPDGEEGQWLDVSANQVVLVERGQPVQTLFAQH